MFDTYKIKDVTIKNRIVMAPMCQFSATNDGLPTSWHMVHYTSRAIGGVGLILLEATGVESRGRISDYDLGLWNDVQRDSLKAIVEKCKKYDAVVGIQLSHAGRKCECKNEQPVAPTVMDWSSKYKKPIELSKEDIKDIIKKFKEAAKRALDAGFQVIELHAAHGYLIHEFLSPLSNKRTDEYGSSTENRVRFLKEVIASVKEVWPDNNPLFVRVSADDYIEGGINIEEMTKILSYIKDSGVDIIHVSSGGLLPAEIKVYPGYQVGYSETIKKELNFKTAAVGVITEPKQAEDILQEGKADLIALGRVLLREPYWPLRAAHELNAEIKWPEQYERGKYRK